MNYLVDYGTRKRPVFATIIEAASFAEDIRKATGEIVGVFETSKPVTYKYKGGKI